MIAVEQQRIPIGKAISWQAQGDRISAAFEVIDQGEKPPTIAVGVLVHPRGDAMDAQGAGEGMRYRPLDATGGGAAGGEELAQLLAVRDPAELDGGVGRHTLEV